jgi:hypothetical protein
MASGTITLRLTPGIPLDTLMYYRRLEPALPVILSSGIRPFLGTPMFFGLHGLGLAPTQTRQRSSPLESTIFSETAPSIWGSPLLLLNSDAVEERPSADRICVSVRCDSWLSWNVGRQREKGQYRCRIGAALQEVSSTGHALPSH